jgi:hypothetical protein
VPIWNNLFSILEAFGWSYVENLVTMSSSRRGGTKHVNRAGAIGRETRSLTRRISHMGKGRRAI